MLLDEKDVSKVRRNETTGVNVGIRDAGIPGNDIIIISDPGVVASGEPSAKILVLTSLRQFQLDGPKLNRMGVKLTTSHTARLSQDQMH